MKYIKRILGVILFTALGLYILGSFVDSDTDEDITKDSVIEDTSESKEPAEPIQTSDEEPNNISSKPDYETIKEDYDLFGKWEIYNEYMNFGYIREIYRLKDEYIMVDVFDKEDKKITELRVEDSFYYTDNGFGEFMVIDKDNNITLFDETGKISVEGSGYTITQL